MAYFVKEFEYDSFAIFPTPILSWYDCQVNKSTHKNIQMAR